MREQKNILMNERGGAGVSAVLAIALLAACVFVLFQLVPIYWDHWSLEDEIKTKIQFAFVNYPREVKRHLTEEIKKELNEIEANYKEKDLKINVDERAKKIKIELWYTRSHNVPFYPPNPKQFYIKLENTPI
ncbi:hypothetical protein CSA56_11675 [candidate division KSB3 bacterium]|uniref:Uncharacterized protein n=1 Tax=candidate division KSB3 bacterium TaxID=2044937 RepID=A0A2G6KF76_9BACT|nr:MAG: hypothetical protein CSA56_11675 [candidate division KSB3 bacterium]